MLNKLGFSRNERDDSIEKNIFTSKNTIQLAFKITYDDYIKRREIKSEGYSTLAETSV